MSSIRQVRAGGAYVELTARDNKLIQGLQRASKRLKAFAASVRTMGLQLFGAGVTAALPFGLSVMTFANFEQQMARVKALTGASGDDFAKLEALAKRMGATTVFSASQAAEAMSYFALAGFSTEQIMDALGPTLNLAAAGQIEIAEAADIAAKIMSGMGIDAQDLGNAIDVMAKAMTTANTDLTMLGEAFKFVGPMAKTAGISLEEITAAIQLLSNAGVQGEMAGTTLRGMILSLTSPSAEAQKELDRLGVSVLDTAGNVRPLVDIIADLERSLSGVGSGEKLRVLGTIFPARQAAGAAELVSQGAERLREATESLRSASGTASRIAATQLDTLKGDFEILMSSLEGVALAIGEALGGSLRKLTQGVSNILSIFGQWISTNQRVVLAVAGAVVGVTVLGVGLVALGISAKIIAFAFSGLAAALALMLSLITAILSPMGLLVTAAAALGIYLLFASDVGTQALAWLAQKFAALKETAVASWQAIGKALADGNIELAAKILWLALKMEWQRGVNYLTGLWLKFKKSFVDVASEASYGAASSMIDASAGIEAGWLETVDFLSDAWTLFTNLMTQTWHSTIGFIRKAWVRLKSLFDNDIDVDAEVEKINQETQASKSTSEKESLESIGERDKRRKDERNRIEEDRKNTQETLDEMQSAEQSQRDAQFESELSESERQLVEARKAWQAAIAETQDDTGSESDSENPPQPKLPEVKASLAASRDLLDDQQRQVETKGGFNALALQGIGSDSLSERTAKASEQIAVNTQALVDQAKQGRLVFAD